jgi:hypothetical protein
MKRKRRKARIDKVAAQIMLAAYLEARPGELDSMASIDGPAHRPRRGIDREK